MDGKRFDGFARLLSDGASRRTLLGGLVAGAGAALLGRTALAAAAGPSPDRCKGKEQRCAGGNECCGKLACQKTPQGGGRRCCVPPGGPCETGINSDRQCCGRSVICDGGTCKRT